MRIDGHHWIYCVIIIQNETLQYVLKTHREEFVLKVSDIVSLEADGMYTHIVLKDERITASKPMKEILADLPETFFRTHRSYALNTEQVAKPVRIGVSGVKTSIGTFVPISSRNKAAFIAHLDRIKEH